LTFLLAGCGSGGSPEGAGESPGPDAQQTAPPFESVIDDVAPLISDADIDFALPAAIDVDGAGNVWIADRTLHQVRVVSADGEVLRTIGRDGGGPGEFRFPRGLAVRGEHVYVLDNAHGVQRFDMAGDYAGEYDPAVRVLFDFDFTGDGGIVVSNNRVWARGGLAAVLGPDGEERGLVGEPPFAGAEGFNFTEVREAIRGGEIPDVARNGALPVAAPDGSLWAVLHTEARVRRYGVDGELMLERAFELPELAAIEAQFFEDFRDAPASDTFFFPSFAADGVATADGLLLLWDTVAGDPALVTVHDRDGAVAQRWLLPAIDIGGGGVTVLTLALDASRRRLYIGVSDVATIFAADLPQSVRLPPG
jgi:hypothetical protein